MRPATDERRKPRPEDWGERRFETVADAEHYRLSLPGLGIVFDLDRLRLERGELRGHLTVRAMLAGARTIDGTGVLLSGTFGASSLTTRKQLAGVLADRADAFDVDWHGLLEELCLQTDAAFRAGAPAIDLRTVPLTSEADATWDVAGLRILREHPTMIYGQGDSLKSFVMAYVLGSLQRQGVRTLLVDWEMTSADHKRRLVGLFGADHPGVQYLRADRPLTVEADRIRCVIHDAQIQYVALDSVAFGCGGPPEQAEHALAFMGCVRRFGIGALLLAHQAKGENGDRSPFGSAFWFNAARLIYHAKRSESGRGEPVTAIALSPTKTSTTGNVPHVGLEFDFTRPGQVDVRRRDVADVGDDVAATLPLRLRIRSALRRGPLTYIELAAELSAKVDTVERTVQRHPGLFTRVSGKDGVLRAALLERSA
ncbi:MAG: hypothetical protein KJ066_16285 [Acidobacteria bacterium]|nr:hypothetical protein [Acidobacteriota bacterium]